MLGFLCTVLWWLFLAVVCLALVSYIQHPAPYGSQPYKTKFMSWTFCLLAQTVFIGAKKGWWNKIKGLRYLVDDLAKQKGCQVQTQDAEFDGVKVKLYFPKVHNEKSVPGVLFYHGGGWTIGRADTHDLAQGRMAADLGAVLVSVDYPRRPECSIDDLYDNSIKATKYFIQNASQWNVDPTRIAIGGSSAGANIATTICIHLRNEKFSPMPKLQLLWYGCYQMVDLTLPSYIQYNHGPVMHRESLYTVLSCFIFGQKWEEMYDVLDQQRLVPPSVKKLYSKYLDHSLIPVENRYPPYRPPYQRKADMKVWEEFKDVVLDTRVSPLLTEDLSNLPEALVVSAQYDPVRDESFLYAKRLREAGNTVTHHHDPVGFHSGANSFKSLQDCEHTMKTILELTKCHL